jgi:hypothetical protein
MVERGVIRNRALAQKIRDFSGLRYGKITPSDIDAAMEFNGRLFIFIEGKRTGAPLPFGQRLMFERITDAIDCPPVRVCTTVIVDHDDVDGVDVDYAAATVRAYRWKGNWQRPMGQRRTLREFVDRMVAFESNMRRAKLRVLDGGRP